MDQETRIRLAQSLRRLGKQQAKELRRRKRRARAKLANSINQSVDRQNAEEATARLGKDERHRKDKEKKKRKKRKSDLAVRKSKSKPGEDVGGVSDSSDSSGTSDAALEDMGAKVRARPLHGKSELTYYLQGMTLESFALTARSCGGGGWSRAAC